MQHGCSFTRALWWKLLAVVITKRALVRRIHSFKVTHVVIMDTKRKCKNRACDAMFSKCSGSRTVCGRWSHVHVIAISIVEYVTSSHIYIYIYCIWKWTVTWLSLRHVYGKKKQRANNFLWQISTVKKSFFVNVREGIWKTNKTKIPAVSIWPQLLLS